MGFPIDIWSHPIGSMDWKNPPPCSYGIMPPPLTLHCIASCGIFIKLYIYMISQNMLCLTSTITIGINLNHLYTKHQINGRSLALSSLP